MKDWETEFDEKFQDPMEKKHGKGFALYCSYCDGTWRDEIKSFIRDLLSSRDTYWKERVRKEVEGMRWRDEWTDEEKALAQDIFGQPYTTPDYIKDRMYGFNRALDLLLNNLKV